MRNGHYGASGASIDYGDAGFLFPVEELDAAVHQYREAELALDDADGSAVITIAPTSHATAHFLGQHPLTAIPIESLPTEIKTQLADSLETHLEQFTLIQIGTWTSESTNHALVEFTDA